MRIDSPEDLRRLPRESLPQVCDELRRYLLNSVSRSSGHLASGLGVVELTTALHYVYNTPFDQLIWDVGHQAYPHKILTGRRDQMLTIRQKDGLHPFPWREESEFDVLSVGHSSTSISAGLGIALAENYKQSGKKVACIIGDGAMTAGMAFEAMNHAGHTKPDMLVILNDNDMSISENVGGLSQHLAQILSSKEYISLRESGKKILSGLPPIKEFLKKTEEHLKGLVTPAILFEELGFNYIGPVDGHDIDTLVSTLKRIRHLKGPQLLHVITKKGKGYAPAEQDPILWHGVPKFDPKQGTIATSKQSKPTYSDIFGDWLCEVAEQDNKLIAITPAMREGSGMTRFAQKYPQQFFDVAIAEQHAVTLAAGFAISGLRPVVAIYSTFLQRAYDQLIHDIAIQNLPVLFAVDRAGIVGADGPTHQGQFDLSYLRTIPNLVIMTPSDENECRHMLTTGYTHQGPSVVRYPRGCGTGIELTAATPLPVGKATLKRQGHSIALLNFGPLLTETLKVAAQIDATVVDMRFVKPLDNEMLTQIAESHDLLVTIEENVIQGGAGSAVNEFILSHNLKCDMLNIGLPDQFIPQGEQNEIRSDFGLNETGILQQIQTRNNRDKV
ncbi:1-deoxy-D-xylulose-5-phosphate synthase [Zophobihabitans entericus]|uniref:1-deoxy-D-xylulose-5-phosphate synthase n=1 Tax=Zophobihabitans entericus TaxID=1635327 RepID=A0A6G9IFL5_9GAMM|nr:1-deoxy-D-xylulose-5-phosphate synthase [Zophobihabitans entericus]